MPKGGIEPPLPGGNRILSPARLPVPPLRPAKIVPPVCRRIAGTMGSRKCLDGTKLKPAPLATILRHSPVSGLQLHVQNLVG